MAKKNLHGPDSDLDRTDRLPILEGTFSDHDVEDDAVPLDHTAVLPGPSLLTSSNGPSDFVRAAGVDLPSLAESVRSVEERISRQAAEYEALARAHERVLDAESALVTRANALAIDLAAARNALETEQGRSRDFERLLNDKNGVLETARSRTEEALRDSERYQGESRTLRDSLTARDAAIAQALHSLGERDAQLSALQAEHARIMPALEATSKSTTQLDAELQVARARGESLAAELKASRELVSALNLQITRNESEVNAARSELGAVKSHASTYLEALRTREWRHGFDQNMFREMDAQVGAAHAGHGALEAERAYLKDQISALEAQLASKIAATEAEQIRLTAQLGIRDGALAEAVERANRATARVVELEEATHLTHAETATQMAYLRVEQSEQIARLQSEAEVHKQEMAVLKAQLGIRDGALAEAVERANRAAAKVAELEEATQLKHAQTATQMAALRVEQTEQIARLQSEAEEHEQEMAVLMAHLQEARRPIQSIETDVKRLTEELAAKTAAFAAADAESRNLQGALERARGALEEREFLIRRLERSESNNANVLGRIQTSIERLGATPIASAPPGAAPPVAEWSAELIRIDGERPITHVLSRRTRIGRATGCELHIDSGSVSRHHALVLVGPREAIIEDLNSTNGIHVNGRKVSRQVLCDGDAVTVGEIQFRYLARPVQRTPEANPVESGA